MDVCKLRSELKYVETNGCTLNLDERARLELGSEQLTKDLNDGSQLYLWGKIRGTVRDYFIVYHLKNTETAQVPEKCFYWCSSLNFVFSSLPKVEDKHRSALLSRRELFSGEFDTIIQHSTEAPKVIDAEAGIVLPPKHLTELDRLSATVSEIDRACTCLPKGALKFTPLKEVVHNEAFRGLSRDAAFDLGNWYHFRKVESDDKKDLIARDEAVYNDDFLDSVSLDKPNESWTIIPDATNTVATLRSQLWPGYYAFHRCNTPVYGSVYIGDGIKNVDLPFML